MSNSTILYHFLVEFLHQLPNKNWWGLFIFIGIALVLWKIMMKAISSIDWNFDPTSGNAVMVEHPGSKIRHTDAESNENIKKIGSKELPIKKADIDPMVSLLNKNGIQKYDSRDYQGALVDFNAAFEIEPQCALTLKYLGEIKRILGQSREALIDLNLANKMEPNDVFTLSARGAVYKDLNDYENALKDLDKADELNSNHYFIKTQRAIVKRSLRDFQGALVDLTHEANAASPFPAYILTQLGVIKRELGQFDEALDFLNRACELKSNDAFIYQQRGVVRRALNDLEGALKDLNIAHELKSNDAYTLRRRGITRRELLDYQGSLEDLNKANTLKPYNDFTLSERGVTKRLLGDFQGALQDLTMANHIKPQQAFTLKHRGSVHRALGNINEAIHDLTYAHNLESNDFFTLWELAMTKKLSGDYAGSLVLYDKVVEMEPNYPSILRQRGTLKRMLGDFRGALDDFNKVDDSQTVLYNKDLETIKERCFTKYAMKDIAGAMEDAKIVCSLWGVNGQSSIRGEELKQATTQSAPGPSESASSMSQKLCNIEKSTTCHHILWIEHSKLLFVKNLGTGSYGFVHKCKWVDKNIDVAVKYMVSQIKDAFEYEVRMLANIRHPRIVTLIGCSYDDEEEQGVIVMELMQQNLRSLIDSKKRDNGQPFDLEMAVDIMYQIAEGMAYLHDQGVLHRDLKSSNVLVDKGVNGKDEYVRVKIADFGMAKLQGKNNMPYFMTVDVGTTLWRAPEVFRSDAGVCHKYSFPADVWSYGMTCYEILTGNAPFEGVARSQIYQKVLCGLRPELPASCPKILKSLLTKCWSLMPFERPTFSDIHKTLKLYLGRDSSKDLKAGDVIQLHELRRLSSS